MRKASFGFLLIAGMLSFLVTAPLLGIKEGTMKINTLQFIILGLSPLSALVLWFWMILDFFQRKNIKHKVLWGMVLFLANWIGAILYFIFIFFPKENKLSV